jgi:hypothetical protein
VAVSLAYGSVVCSEERVELREAGASDGFVKKSDGKVMPVLRLPEDAVVEIEVVAGL